MGQTASRPDLAMNSKSGGMKTWDAVREGGIPPHRNPVLEVKPCGSIADAAAETYISERRQKVAGCLQALLQNSEVKKWAEAFAEADLHDKDSGEYLGDASCKAQSVAALHAANAAQSSIERVAALEEFILFFCGFHSMGAKYIVNAVHFQFSVDAQKLLSTQFSSPSAVQEPSAADKNVFDEGEIVFAELLLRVVVQTQDGLVGNAFSPGRAMSFLHKLPLFAQLVMVLINSVEAEWYQQSIPWCPMAINVYASLLTEGAPVEQMVGAAKVVEVMEMTKGATRGTGVVGAVRKIRDHGATVMLDDYDLKHPAIDSKPDGIKVSVMANATHSLQAFTDGGVPPAEQSQVGGEIKDSHYTDYYGAFIPRTQPDIKWIVLEGSENCLKSLEKGPPLNFKEKKATIASAHVYQFAAQVLCAMQPDLKILHQGGRALYDDEEFDSDALQLMQRLVKSPESARAGDAGTMAWMGEEAVRRAAMRVRPLVSGVTKKNSVVHI